MSGKRELDEVQDDAASTKSLPKPKRLRQSRICFSNGKLTAELPNFGSSLKGDHSLNVSNHTTNCLVVLIVVLILVKIMHPGV